MRPINFYEKWIPMEHPDVPLTKEQYTALCNGFIPHWEARYETIALGRGWFCTYRSGWLLEKFRYKKGDDGQYHLVEFFHKSKGYDDISIQSVELSYFVCHAMYEGDYKPSLRDKAIEIMKSYVSVDREDEHFDLKLKPSYNGKTFQYYLDRCRYYKGENEVPEQIKSAGNECFWKYEKWWVIQHFVNTPNEVKGREKIFKKHQRARKMA